MVRYYVLRGLEVISLKDGLAKIAFPKEMEDEGDTLVVFTHPDLLTKDHYQRTLVCENDCVPMISVFKGVGTKLDIVMVDGEVQLIVSEPFSDQVLHNIKMSDDGQCCVGVVHFEIDKD